MYTGPKSRSSTDEEEAQGLAIDALAWLAEDLDRLQRFLAVSGLGPQNLRSAASEPGFLGAVLDYLAANEHLLIAFATHRNVTPDSVMRGRERLSGGRTQDEE